MRAAHNFLLIIKIFVWIGTSRRMQGMILDGLAYLWAFIEHWLLSKNAGSIQFPPHFRNRTIEFRKSETHTQIATSTRGSYWIVVGKNPKYNKFFPEIPLFLKHTCYDVELFE
jgi:hypothetical protein